MKIMLEMTNYAKNYANTIYQSLMKKLRKKRMKGRGGEEGFPHPTPLSQQAPSPRSFFQRSFLFAS